MLIDLNQKRIWILCYIDVNKAKSLAYDSPCQEGSGMTTRIGFFIFAGLVAGAVAGNLLAASPGPGALAGGLFGLILGGVLDYRDWRKGGGE